VEIASQYCSCGGGGVSIRMPRCGPAAPSGLLRPHRWLSDTLGVHSSSSRCVRVLWNLRGRPTERTPPMRVCLQGLRRSMGGSSPISSHFRLVVRLRRACFSADSSSPENSTFPTALASCCHPKRLAMSLVPYSRLTSPRVPWPVKASWTSCPTSSPQRVPAKVFHSFRHNFK